MFRCFSDLSLESNFKPAWKDFSKRGIYYIKSYSVFHEIQFPSQHFQSNETGRRSVQLKQPARCSNTLYWAICSNFAVQDPRRTNLTMEVWFFFDWIIYEEYFNTSDFIFILLFSFHKCKIDLRTEENNYSWMVSILARIMKLPNSHVTQLKRSHIIYFNKLSNSHGFITTGCYQSYLENL